MKLENFIKRHAKSKYIFTNSKTSGISIDFGICGFMNFNKEGVLASKSCTGCYSAILLNIYHKAREKLVNNNNYRNSLTPEQLEEDVKIFENDIKIVKSLGVDRLRFYALSDFSPKDIPYILAASKHITVDIISKTLMMPMNRQYLNELNNRKNIWISLSFNFKFEKFFDEICLYLKETKSKNIQLNWTINYKNEQQKNDPRLKKVQVIHVTNKDKRNALNFGFKETQVCGVFDKDGNRTKKGVCDSCNNCHLSFNAHQNGKKAKLPSILLA